MKGCPDSEKDQPASVIHEQHPSLNQIPEHFVLYQNIPNPCRDITRIGFDLPYAHEAGITIYYQFRQVIKTILGDFARGYNEVELKIENLNYRGMLYYQIEFDKYIAVRSNDHNRLNKLTSFINK